MIRALSNVFFLLQFLGIDLGIDIINIASLPQITTSEISALESVQIHEDISSTACKTVVAAGVALLGMSINKTRGTVIGLAVSGEVAKGVCGQIATRFNDG